MIAHRCTVTRDGQQVACVEREQATRSGHFFFSFVHRGWVHTDTPKRRMTARVAYYAGRDTTGLPFLYGSCPWCGGDLPDIAASADATADTGEGAEEL